MNKCNFCSYSIPTSKMMCTWTCEYKEFGKRALFCEQAIETMMKYNEIRANNNINKMSKKVKE